MKYISVYHLDGKSIRFKLEDRCLECNSEECKEASCYEGIILLNFIGETDSDFISRKERSEEQNHRMYVKRVALSERYVIVQSGESMTYVLDKETLRVIDKIEGSNPAVSNGLLAVEDYGAHIYDLEKLEKIAEINCRGHPGFYRELLFCGGTFYDIKNMKIVRELGSKFRRADYILSNGLILPEARNIGIYRTKGEPKIYGPNGEELFSLNAEEIRRYDIHRIDASEDGIVGVIYGPLVDIDMFEAKTFPIGLALCSKDGCVSIIEPDEEEELLKEVKTWDGILPIALVKAVGLGKNSPKDLRFDGDKLYVLRDLRLEIWNYKNYKLLYKWKTPLTKENMYKIGKKTIIEQLTATALDVKDGRIAMGFKGNKVVIARTGPVKAPIDGNEVTVGNIEVTVGL